MPFRRAASTRAKRTLLVEDNPRECQAMAESLSRAGFKADCANSAGGALAKVELDSKPLAAIVDLKLPDGSGGLVVWRIRRSYGHDVPIAIVTGNPDLLSHPDLVRDPPDRVFAKPVDMDELITWLQNVTGPAGAGTHK